MTKILLISLLVIIFLFLFTCIRIKRSKKKAQEIIEKIIYELSGIDGNLNYNNLRIQRARNLLKMLSI